MNNTGSAQIGDRAFKVKVTHFRNPLSVHSKYMCHFTIAPRTLSTAF